MGRENANNLKEKYTVLELDTFTVNGQDIESYCVIPGEKITLDEIPHLSRLTIMHESLISELKKNNYDFVEQALEHLIGHFGGEMDSFYAHVKERIATHKKDTQ